MKYLPLFAVAIFLTPTLEAGNKTCCRVQTCNPCGTGRASVTQWYTAKDGTLREKMPYREALSRAEDADDMEIALRGVREELTATQTVASEQKDALAALRTQLEEQVAATAAQTARAEKAEADHQAAATQVAELQETAKNSEATLTQVQAQLKEATAVGADLKTQMKSLTEERENLTAQIKTAADEINVLKQAAAKTEKVAIASEDYEADPPQEGDADDAPAEPAAE